MRIEIEMNNSAGVFQVDELLATTSCAAPGSRTDRGGRRIDAEHEKRLVMVSRI